VICNTNQYCMKPVLSVCLIFLSCFFLIVCLLFLCVLWALLPDSNEKALRETQTLRAGCSKAKPKNFTPLHTPFPGARDDQNLISWRSMVTTFTYTNPVWRGAIHATSSYSGNRPTNKQTHAARPPARHRQDR